METFSSMLPKNPKQYVCEMEVRGYELDKYGHVNHANYFSYLEHARWKMLESEDLTFQKFEELNAWPIVVGVTGKYIKPLFIADQIRIETLPCKHTAVKMYFDQKIYIGNKLIFTAEITAAMANKEGRPVKIPDVILKLWETQ